MAIVFIGLGTNLGDREENMKNAILRLAEIPYAKIRKKSSIIETEPVDYLDQPLFLNQVVVIETDLTPFDLLRELKSAEIDLGREKSFPKGPRTIDLDILLYDNLILDSSDLTIPHPQIKNRQFIMQHLIELEPDLVDPATGKKYREIQIPPAPPLK